VRARGALAFTFFLAALSATPVSAQTAPAPPASPPTASAKITFVGIDRERYVLVEADFALDNRPLATLNESAEPTGTVLFNRELPAGDHLFAAEIAYRRAGGGLFSNGTGNLLRVSGSLQFHAEPGQALSITSRIQPRVDVVGKSEWLSLSTVIDTADTSTPSVAAKPPDKPATPPTRFVTITAPAATPDKPVTPPDTTAPEKKPETATAAEPPPEKKPSLLKKKESGASAALLRLRMKLHAAADLPAKKTSAKPKLASKAPAKKGPGGDAAANRLKSLLRKAAAKNGNP
jgi:hypothetical protein